MATLYEIDEMLSAVINNAVDPDTGEIIPSWEKELEGLMIDREKKLEGYALVIKNEASNSNEFAAEIKALQRRKKTADAKVLWLKKVLLSALDGEKLETPRVKVYYGATNSIIIDDKVDAEKYFLEGNDQGFVSVNEHYSFDKDSIKEAIQGGKEIPWASLVKRKHLVIK